MSRARDTGGGLSLACLFLLCPAAALARQATTPAPQAPPAAVIPAEPAAQTSPKAPARAEDRTPRAPRPAPAPPALAPSAPTPAARVQPPRRAPLPPQAAVPPREVVTVIHRLSGWKLLAWLATSGPSAVVLDELPSPSDAHTNIVAGYVYEDGRSVVARLPQAEVELESFDTPQPPPSFFPQAGNQVKPEPEYTLVTSDGRRFEAKFVGLDSSTGLTMLEASEPLLAGAPAGDAGDTDDPTVGQRVRLYAPIPAEAPPRPAALPAPPAPPRSNYIYLSIDQKEGRLTRLVRAPSGNLSSVVVSANVSPEWVGAVAANELGEVVGIVSQSRDGETRVLPVTTVREACERVLKLRGTVPQPWLGVRGNAVAQAPLQTLVENGWKPEVARTLIAKRQGVYLTSVAPKTPAALAGLKAGDLIESVGPRVVRSVDDLSMTLKEAGVGSVVDLTVWRALSPGPLKLSVELKGAKNPAFATAEAEQRAVSARVTALRVEVSELQAELAGLRDYVASPELTARAARIRARLDELRPELRRDWELMQAAEGRAAAARTFSVGGAQTLSMEEDVTGRLKTYGLHVVGLTRTSAAALGAEGGLLVVAVQPESPAAASGLLPWDVIETVNGSPVERFEPRRLASDPEAKPAVFGLVRGGKRLSVNFPPAPAPERQR
ncbi:MAG: PDZ domain-containing protein [Acidobacteria bacterium]|nr:PDZ domain-containing protein [Acidobacteriota bacterium]